MKFFCPKIWHNFLISSVLLLQLFGWGQSGKILFYFGLGNYSHRIAVWPLVEKLIDMGHQVTFLSSSPPKPIHVKEKVTEFVPQILSKFLQKSRASLPNILTRRLSPGGGVSTISLWLELQELGTGACEALMGDGDFIGWVQNVTKFDLIIVDAMFNECGLGIANFQQTKVIIFDSTHVYPWMHEMYGLADETSWVSDLILGFHQPMNLGQQILNVLSPVVWHFYRKFWIYPRLNNAIRQGLQTPTDLGSFDLEEVEKKCSLVLINSFLSLDHPRSLPPNFVSVGGMHVVKSRGDQVPTKIEQFMNESTDGFIYVSFGTGAKISETDVEFQQKFFHAFGNSSTKFLWKWETNEKGFSATEDEMPPNVLTSNWMPQSEILAHPNLKAFIMHGGLLSIMEAMVGGIPLIICPIFAEQHFNAERAETMGYGISLDLMRITQDEIQNAIKTILIQSKYKEKMMEMSRFFQDRQNPPLDTAVWWVEWVLRQNGSENLFFPRTALQNNWFVRRNLHVWLILFGPLLLLFGIILGGFCHKMPSPQSSVAASSIKRKKKNV